MHLHTRSLLREGDNRTGKRVRVILLLAVFFIALILRNKKTKLI